MKILCAGILVLSLAATSFGQGPRIDEEGTARLKQELAALGIQYVEAQKTLPLTPQELDQVPAPNRPAMATACCWLSLHGMKGQSWVKLSSFPVTHLHLDQTDVADIAFVKDMPLIQLNISQTMVEDLSPLKGKKLFAIDIKRTRVRDISPLESMPLYMLDLAGTSVSNLAPVATMPQLKVLFLDRCQVTDVTPLRTTQLEKLYLPKTITKGLEVVRTLKTLKEIGQNGSDLLPVDMFWKKHDAAEATSSAEQAAGHVH